MLEQSPFKEVAQTQRSIEQARLEVVTSVENLKKDLKQATDWRRRVEIKPWKFVGIALAIGFFVGLSRSHRN